MLLGVLMQVLCLVFATALSLFPGQNVVQRPIDAQLIASVKADRLGEVRRLLHLGAHANARELLHVRPSLAENTVGGSPFFENTALMFAVQGPDLRLTQMLLANGAYVNFKDRNGDTPLMMVSGRPLEKAKLLLSYKANPNLEDKAGFTALSCASRAGEDPLVRLLVHYGASLNGGSGGSPLEMAIANDRIKTVRLLLRLGADPNFRDSRGYTPLEQALQKDSVDIARSLAKAGGMARPLAELRQLRAKDLKDREDAAKPDLERKPELIGEDLPVISAMMDGMLADPKSEISLWTRGGPLFLGDSIKGGYTDSADMGVNDELTEKEALAISLDMRKSAESRGSGSVEIKNIHFSSSRIKLASFDEAQENFGSHEDVFVMASLPGYSADRKSAFVTFWCRPTRHAATGVAFLTIRNERWHLSWCRVQFYV
jgi:ankyrin repeat protein